MAHRTVACVSRSKVEDKKEAKFEVELQVPESGARVAWSTKYVEYTIVVIYGASLLPRCVLLSVAGLQATKSGRFVGGTIS